MHKDRKKKLSIAVLALVLMLSQAVTSLAGERGVMSPEDHILFAVLAAHGVYTPNSLIGHWVEAYKGYLRSIGDSTLLSRLEGYDKLSWGSTAQGVDELFYSVGDWLSSSDDYGKPLTPFYILPSSSLPLETVPPSSIVHEARPIAYRSVRDDSLMSGTGLVYSFSFVRGRTDGKDGYEVWDYYIPDKGELFGTYLADRTGGGSSYGGTVTYEDRGRVSLFMYSDGSLKDANVRAIYRRYSPSGVLEAGPTRIDPEHRILAIGAMSLPALPFKVFFNKSTLSAYLSGGLDISYSSGFTCLSVGSYTDGSCDIQGFDHPRVGSQFVLPSGPDAAQSLWDRWYSNFSPSGYGLGTVSYLKDLGLDIAFDVPYGLAHHIQDYAPDGSFEWIGVSEDALVGEAGEPAPIIPLDLPGYTYDPDLTAQDAAVLLDGSLVVPVYYTRDPVSYRVEYYTEDPVSDGDSPSWILADAVDMTGFPGVTAEIPEKAFPGCTLDASRSVPADQLVPEDEGTVLQVYYTLDRVPYTVEHYTEVFLPGAAKKSWTLADTDTLMGVPGQAAQIPEKDLPGFTLDASLTDPADRLILEDGGLTLRVYYTATPLSVITGPVKGAVSTALPYAAAVGGFFSCGFCSLRLFKRITGKA